MARKPGYENTLYKVKPELYNDENFMQVLNRVRSGSLSIKDVPLAWRITMQADSQYQERIANRAQQSDLTLEEVRLLSVMSKIGAPISDELRNKLDRRKLGERVDDKGFGTAMGAAVNPRWVKDSVEAGGDREVIVGPAGQAFLVPEGSEVSEEPEVLSPEEKEIVESIAKGPGPDYVAQRSIPGNLPVDTKSKSEYTRGEALRITNQMAANRDPNWKAFWKKEEEKGFSDKEDPSLAEGAKEVWKWLTKDRPKRETDKKPNTQRRGSPRKKGGVVNKRVTKQYAKGGSVRTPKRIK